MGKKIGLATFHVGVAGFVFRAILLGCLLLPNPRLAAAEAGLGLALSKGSDGRVIVRRVFPGSPAAASKKIQENDEIVAVAQGSGAPVQVQPLSLGRIIQMIRGPVGTEVRLTLVPEGKQKADQQVVSLVRAELKILRPEPRKRVPPADTTLGKPAPEIEGIDVDGKKFKLSDYRGKVVLLDFWGDW